MLHALRCCGKQPLAAAGFGYQTMPGGASAFEGTMSSTLPELREWIANHTQAPAGPSAPAAYQREFLIRVADELERLYAELNELKGKA